MRAGRDLYNISGDYPTFILGNGPSWVGVTHPMRTDPRRVSAVDSPSRLLSVRAGPVPYVGRRDELDALEQWRNDDRVRASVKLVYGPGGRGKTRLGVEFGKSADAAGWGIWEARVANAARSTGLKLFRDGTGNAVIIDYAERWPVGLLTEFIEDMAVYASDTALRVLLLARYAPWFGLVRSRLVDSHAADIEIASDLPLAEVEDSGRYRTELFTKAAASYVSTEPYRGNVALENVSLPADLADESYGLELTVLMAALTAVDVQYRGQELPSSALLSQYILDRERRHWRDHTQWNTRDADTVDARAERLAKTVYCATLFGQQDRDRALRVLTMAQVTGNDQAQAALRDHSEFYPPEPGTLLAPLLPDRLGEDYLALATPGTGAQGGGVVSADLMAWAATVFPTESGDSGWLSTIVTTDGVPTSQARWPMTMLVEAAKRWPHLVPHLRTLIHLHPGLALSAGSATLTAIADLFGDDAATLAAIDAGAPPHNHTELDVGLAVLAVNLTRSLPADIDDEVLAVRLQILSVRLAWVGRHGEALAAVERAAKVLERSALSEPDRYESDLASCLSRLGIALAEEQRYDEAMSAVERATEIYTRLAESGSVSHVVGLAETLSNLGNQLGEVGRTPEGLSMMERAIDLLSDAIDKEPGYETQLAHTLTNYSVHLARWGREHDALAAVRRAVHIYTRLAESNPEQHLPALSNGLNNLGLRLSRVGRDAEGLDTMQRAVDTRTILVDHNPARYELDLAESLANVALLAVRAGRIDDALAAGERAVAICSRRVESEPGRFRPKLAKSLNCYGSALAAAKRPVEALAAMEEAVGAYTRLAREHPRNYGLLAGALNNLSPYLADAGRNADALHAAEHSVDIYTRLAGGPNGRHRIGLADSWLTLSVELARAERQPEAFAAGMRSVEILQGMVEVDPAVFQPRLADALARTALLATAGEAEDAVAMTAEALRLYDRLERLQPGRFEERVDLMRRFLDQLRDNDAGELSS